MVQTYLTHVLRSCLANLLEFSEWVGDTGEIFVDWIASTHVPRQRELVRELQNRLVAACRMAGRIADCI